MDATNIQILCPPLCLFSNNKLFEFNNLILRALKKNSSEFGFSHSNDPYYQNLHRDFNDYMMIHDAILSEMMIRVYLMNHFWDYSDKLLN